MKRLVFLAFLECVFITTLSASNIEGDTISLYYHLSVQVIPPYNVSSPLRPRTPANPPVVYQNGYTIMWMTPDFCHSIVLINPDDEEIVYDTTVSENDTQIDFPAWLEGQYEIRFMRDTYYYYGTIEL